MRRTAGEVLTAAALLLLAACGASPDTWEYEILARHERARIDSNARSRQWTDDLKSDDEARRRRAAEGLTEIGEPADLYLRAQLRAGDPEPALEALAVIERRPDATPLLDGVANAAVHSPFAVVRAEAAAVLGRRRAIDAAESLAWALTRDADPRVRAAAARSFGDLGAGEAELRGALDDASPAVRIEATRALVKFGIEDGRHLFLEAWRATRDAEEALQMELIWALEAFLPLSDRRFVGEKALGSRHPRVRAASARLLGQSPDPGVAAVLVRALGDVDETVGLAANDALETLLGVEAPEFGTAVERIVWWEAHAGRRP